MPVQMDDRSEFPRVRRPSATLGERLQAGEEEIRARVSQAIAITDVAELYGTEEYSKTRVQYCNGEHEAWVRQYAA